MQDVKLPDGTSLVFPDGMTTAQMGSAIRANFPQYASQFKGDIADRASVAAPVERPDLQFDANGQPVPLGMNAAVDKAIAAQGIEVPAAPIPTKAAAAAQEPTEQAVAESSIEHPEYPAIPAPATPSEYYTKPAEAAWQGLVSSTGHLAGGALKFIDDMFGTYSSHHVRDIGQWFVNNADTYLKAQGAVDTADMGGLGKALVSGANMAGGMVPIGPLGAVGGLPLIGTLFGAQAYQDRMDSMKAAGASDADAHKAAVLDGALNAGVMALMGVGGKFMLGAETAKTAQDVIQQATDERLITPYIKNQLIAQGIQVPAMAAQSAGSQAITNEFNPDSNTHASTVDAAVQGATAAIAYGVLASPFGLLTRQEVVSNAKKINAALLDGNAPVDQRVGAASVVLTGLSNIDPAAAETWRKQADIALATNQPIDARGILIKTALTTKPADVIQEAATVQAISSTASVDDAAAVANKLLSIRPLREAQNVEPNTNARSEIIAPSGAGTDNLGTGNANADVQYAGNGGNRNAGGIQTIQAGMGENGGAKNGGQPVGGGNTELSTDTGLSDRIQSELQGNKAAATIMADNRHDLALRAAIDAMGPEEKVQALYFDKTTGLKNAAAFDRLQHGPRMAFIDADGLGWLNDNGGHDVGDQSLAKIGSVLGQLTHNAYHLHGDEFVVTADNDADLHKIIAQARDALKNETISFEKDGKQYTVNGLSISYGVGGNKNEADTQMYLDKAARRTAGTLVAKGQPPLGLTIGEKNASTITKTTAVDELASRTGETRAGESGGVQRSQQGLEAAGSSTEAVQRHAISPEKENLLNVGMNTEAMGGKGSPDLTEAQIRAELSKLGIEVTRAAIHQSDTEPTLSAALSRPLTAEEAHQFSTDLKQQAIAQIVRGKGELYGPAADEWKPFNHDYFLTPEGKHPQAEALKSGELAPYDAVHMSGEKREELNGKYYGTKGAGAEKAEITALPAGEPRKSRLYFYDDTGNGIKPELMQGVGHVAHNVELRNIYDGTNNPLKLPHKTTAEFENAVLAHGFDGYRTLVGSGKYQQGATVLLGKAAESVKPKKSVGTSFFEPKQTAAEVIASLPNGMRKTAELMEQRAKQGKRGGLVLGDEEQNMHNASERLAKLHGTDVANERAKLEAGIQNSAISHHTIRAHDEEDAHKIASEYGGRVQEDEQGWKVVTPSVVPMSQDRMLGNKALTNGFYHPELGTAFINIDNVPAAHMPAVILHEITHMANDDKLNAEVMRRINIAPRVQTADKNAIAKSVGISPDDITTNPSITKLTSLLRNAQYQELRGIMDYDGNFHFWDAGKAIHSEGAKAGGLPYDYQRRLIVELRDGKPYFGYFDIGIHPENFARYLKPDVFFNGHYDLVTGDEFAKMHGIDATSTDKLLSDLGVQRSVSRNEIGFYSQLGKAIDNAPDKVFTNGKNVKAWLTANAPKLGVKADEIYWSGVNDWLDTQDKVNKADVAAFLENGGVQVKEVVLGGAKSISPALEQWFENNNRPIPSRSVDWIRHADDIEQIAKQWQQLGDDKNAEQYFTLADEAQQQAEYSETESGGMVRATKYSAHQLPGGDNYRELLLTLPAPNVDGYASTTKLGGGTENKPIYSSPVFKSPHFDQPNILAHIRFNERIDIDGKRVLFLEEIQSDWGQKGKKAGFALPTSEYAALDARRLELERLGGEARNRGEEIPSAIKQEWAGIMNKMQPETQYLKPPTAPFVTDSKAWTALALKRMIIYAVEHGFDRVAWTTGEQQAARYDLSKQVDSIGVYPHGVEGKLFDVRAFRGSDRVIDKENLTASEVENLIGKDLASKSIKQIEQTGAQAFYTGQELKIGGAGMHGYYDQIVPQVANDILKRIGGSRVEQTSLFDTDKPWILERESERGDISQIGRFTTKAEADDVGSDFMKPIVRKESSTQHSFNITPAMREKVQSEGLPLFSKAGEATGDIYSRVRARMDAAGETGNAQEATSYLVEEAMKMGQTAGHSRLDTGFWAWAQKVLPESVVRTLKQWVANIRAALYKNGLMLKEKDLSIDDFVAIAQSNMRALAKGQTEAVGGKPNNAEPREVVRDQNGAPLMSKAAEEQPEQKPVETKFSRFSEYAKRAKDLTDTLVKEFQLGVMPMAAGSEKYRAIAKDYANAERKSRWQWNEFDESLKKNYTPEQRAAMWNAADEQNVLMQKGEDTAGKGLDRLPADQRATMDTLHQYGEELLQRAKDAGMFKGEGLPYWTPRMAVMIGDDGEYSMPPQKGAGVEGTTQGRNITITAPSLKGRKYLTAEETEAAMKGKFGDKAELVRDIRAMPMAMARLERAIAGRELVNQIKELGKKLGEELVSQDQKPGYFTIDHPAFKTYRPRFIEQDGKMVPATDQNGEMIFDRVPLYMRDDMEGPLKSIMSDKSGALYNGLMSLKGKTMSAIMYSPLIHNAVEFGRALPMLPGKVLTLQVYFEGYKAKQDPVQMRQAIDDGLAPIGHRYGYQDISGIMEEPNLKPGRGLFAKVTGGAVGLVNKNAGEAVKSAIDTAGNFWHNTLLWNRVADLQMGIYSNLRRIETARLLKQGLTQEQAEGTAGKIAAHMANRYAGALPNEAMSSMSRKVANLTFFSRSFTFGNLGVMKDVFTGLPRDVQAQISRDFGDLSLRAGKDVARRKAIGAFILDIGLMYAMNSLMQDAFDHLKRDKSLSAIEQSYVDRMQSLLHKVHENPLAVLNSPLDTMAGLTSTADNEPGKENRMLYDYDKNGTGIYVRLPTGKIGEEFIGWTTSPLSMLARKQSTFLRPVIQTMNNDRGFGRRVYNPDDPGVAGAVRNVGKIVKNVMVQQIPNESIQSLINMAGENGTQMDAYKVLGPLMGLTFSKGAPGGPAVGMMYEAARERRNAIADIMPEVNQLIQSGQTEAAVTSMVNAGMSKSEIRLVIEHQLNPQSRESAAAMRKFYKNANESQREKMNALWNR